MGSRLGLAFLGLLLLLPGPGPAGEAALRTKLRDLFRGAAAPTQRVVLLNVWAPCCAHCGDELPALVRLDRALREKGLDAAIVGVCEPGAMRADRERAARAYSLTLPQLELTPQDLTELVAFGENAHGQLGDGGLQSRKGLRRGRPGSCGRRSWGAISRRSGWRRRRRRGIRSGSCAA